MSLNATSTPAPLYTVTLFDMSNFPDNVVYAPDAEVEAVFSNLTSDEAWDIVIEFGNEYVARMDRAN